MKALFKKRQPSGRAPENPAGPHRNPADDAFEEDRIVEDALTSAPLRGQEAPDEREIRASLVEDSVLQQNMEEPRLLTFLPPTASARLDGAGEFHILWSIVMPQVKPAWLTLLILQIQQLWGLSSTYLISEEKKTLAMAMGQVTAGGTVARMGAAGAGALIMLVVPIVAFMLSQSQVLETMNSSGIKE